MSVMQKLILSKAEPKECTSKTSVQQQERKREQNIPKHEEYIGGFKVMLYL